VRIYHGWGGRVLTMTRYTVLSACNRRLLKKTNIFCLSEQDKIQFEGKSIKNLENLHYLQIIRRNDMSAPFHK